MNKIIPYFILLCLLSVLLISDTACDRILPLSPAQYPIPEDWGPYYCTATIYRDLPDNKQFTERYVTYLWPDKDWDGDKTADDDDAYILCSSKIDDYITEYMAPGFVWKKQNISVYKTTADMEGADCNDVDPISPVYGGPWGSALSWQDPDGSGPLEIPQDEAYVSVRFIDADGNEQSAEPNVKHALITLAERAGLPDSSGYYDRTNKHIRIANISIDLKEFTLAGLNINKLHIHNVGSVITEGSGLTATFEPNTIKLYMYGSAENGENAYTSQCLLNDRGTGVGYVIYPPQFSFDLNTQLEVGGLPMWLRVRLQWPAGTKFNINQPYVTLPNPGAWTMSSPAVLEPSFDTDNDGDMSRFLWFKNFEDASSEVFLGEGKTLTNVPLTHGDNEITVVAYDNQGAYLSATSTLTVLNTAPIANDDSYSTDEDTDLVVGNPGVLGNDTDANGDTLSAGVIDQPDHGTLLLNLYGGFVYYPEDDWCGEDSFTYRAHDGADYSNTATVTIAVSCVNDPPVAMDDSYSGYQCTSLEVAAPGVLNNDVDVENDPLTAIKLSSPSNGSLTLNSDGSFTYVPNSNWTGTDNFTYKANDSNYDSNSAMVTIKVNELSPGQQIEKCLKPQIPESPSLNAGQKTSLLSKLNTAIAKYDAGQAKAACNILEAFKNEVISLMDEGVLPQNEGQKFLDLADDIKADMNC